MATKQPSKSSAPTKGQGSSATGDSKVAPSKGGASSKRSAQGGEKKAIRSSK